MKRSITLLGYISVALIVVLTAVFGVLFMAGKRLDRESKAYIDSAVPAIASDWSLDELKKRASREFDDAVDYEEIADYFDTLRQLGGFVSYQGSSGEATISVSFRYGYEITAEYAASADFEEGSAEIQVLLIKQDGLWQILDFKVAPQAFEEDRNIV